MKKYPAHSFQNAARNPQRIPGAFMMQDADSFTQSNQLLYEKKITIKTGSKAKNEDQPEADPGSRNAFRTGLGFGINHNI